MEIKEGTKTEGRRGEERRERDTEKDYVLTNSAHSYTVGRSTRSRHTCNRKPKNHQLTVSMVVGDRWRKRYKDSY